MASASLPFRRYRDFLTPVLHRRFVSVALWCALVSYTIGIWQSTWESLTSLVPIVRPVVLTIAAVMSLVPHISQLHVGQHPSPSPFYGFLRHAWSWETLHTMMWYTGSAILFCEAYMFGRTHDDNLTMVDPGRPYERPRLNERPIYLRTLFMIVGIGQAGMHLMGDKSRLRIPTRKVDMKTGQPIQQETPWRLVANGLSRIAQDALFAMIVYSVLGPFLYASLLRRQAWHLNLTVAKLVFSLPKTNKLTRNPAYVGDLIGRFFIEGFLLLLLWDVASLALNVYIVLPPFKKAEPLTTRAKDANGVLIQGLKVKKEYTRSFAFWELNIIANSSPTRREAIYKDIDRAGGSTWSQLLMICLGELHAISKRIQDFQNPPAFAVPTPQGQILQLPRIAAPINTDEKIYEKSPPPSHFLEASFGSFAKEHGQASGAIDPVNSWFMTILKTAVNTVISEQNQTALSSSFIGQFARTKFVEVLKTPLGPVFRQTFARRSSAVVFGGPSSLSNVSTIADATIALAKLATSSLSEDRYGRVSRDVANIIRTYMSTIQSIENFVRTLDVNWTDVAFDRRKEPDPTAVASNVFGAGEIEAGRKVAEIREVLGALKEGLAALLEGFGDFRDELGLKMSEMRRAKEVVGGPLLLNGNSAGH